MKKIVSILTLAIISFLNANSQTKETVVIAFPPPIFATADLKEYKDSQVLICDTLRSYKILNDTTISVHLKNKFSGTELEILLLGKYFDLNVLKKLTDKKVGFFGDLEFVADRAKLKVNDKNNIVEFL